MRDCSCHINPPCSYCTEKEECIGCGELIHPDEFNYIAKAADDEYGPLCDDCLKEYKEVDI